MQLARFKILPKEETSIRRSEHFIYSTKMCKTQRVRGQISIKPMDLLNCNGPKKFMKNLIGIFGKEILLLFEPDIDDCQSSPCVNGGICSDKLNDSACFYIQRYTLGKTALQVTEGISLSFVNKDGIFEAISAKMRSINIRLDHMTMNFGLLISILGINGNERTHTNKNFLETNV